jgi:hypothetical protein
MNEVMMNKRGQVSVFAILGVVIVALVVLFLFIRNQVYLGSTNIQSLEKEFPQIQEHVEECLQEIGTHYIILAGRQGGYLTSNPGTFRQYKGEPINYLCYNIEGKPECSNRGLRLFDIETSIKDGILKDINTCLDIDQFDKIGLDVSRSGLDIDVDIGDDNTIISANMPVKVSKGELEAQRNSFSAVLDYPLGRLYNSARDIVESEALHGNFDTLTYSVLKTKSTGKPYVVQKLQPYPDKLYVLKLKNIPDEEEFIFQFFIQDEPF